MARLVLFRARKIEVGLRFVDFCHRAFAVGVAAPRLVKLLLHPALVFGLGRAAQMAGLPLSGGQRTALTLAAALPSASNVSLLAERYGADNGRIARIIMASTVLAFGTFSTVAWALGAG